MERSNRTWDKLMEVLNKQLSMCETEKKRMEEYCEEFKKIWSSDEDQEFYEELKSEYINSIKKWDQRIQEIKEEIASL